MKKLTGNYFECVVKYDKTSEDGAMKKVTETYCIEADSFSEAESKATEELAPYSNGEFEIKNITPARYKEIFVNEEAIDTKFYKAKLEFIIINEVTMKEKKTATYYLVSAKDFADSLRIIQDAMKETLVDYVTAQISESKVLEVYWK